MSSIRHRILLVLLGVGFLPLLLVFLVSKTITSRDLENAEREKLAAVGREIARQVGSVMEAAANDLESLRTNRVVTDPAIPMDERIEELRRLVNAYPNFSDITIYSPNGLMEESTTEHDHPEPQDFTAWLEKARDEGIVCTSHPHRILGLDGLHIKVYIPVHLKGHVEPYILKARLGFESVWDLIDGVKVGLSGRMFIIDGHGKILAARNKALILEKFDDKISFSHWINHPYGTYVDGTGKAFAYDAQFLSQRETKVGEPWIVLSVLPKAELTAALRQSEIYHRIAAIGALGVALLLGLALSDRLAKPVILASDAAQRVAQGDLAAGVPETGPLEMRRLAASFNQMIEEVKGSRERLESLVDSRTKKLRESQSDLEALTSQLRAAYESTREAILVVKPDGTILAANRRILEFFGLDPAEDVGSLGFSGFKQRLDGSFADSTKNSDRWTFFEDRPDGIGEAEWEVANPEHRTLSVYTAPVENQRGKCFARLWMFSDITENRRLEQSLQQAQKMEAIGRLAGGVAHDFNNLLTGIIGNLSLAEMESTNKADGDAERFISSAKKAGQRAAELVKQLLGFSRRSHLQLSHCDVNSLIREVQNLLTHTIDPRVQIKVDLPDVLWSINADATQIEQVIMNMCVNAKDAMQEHGGRIALSTRNVHFSEEQAAQMSGAEAGPYVRISIEDNGHGMSEEVKQKIFEPFFTTKEPGKGTGLGLATSYGIIRQHGGWIACDSEVGVGTTFHIYLPRVEGPAPAEHKTVQATVPTRKGTETVLLVDDEEVVRAVAEGTLKHHGYKVICASDGLRALEICEERRDEIDVVILDLTMPRLSGRDTFRRLSEAENPLPVIICSGYLVDLNVFEEETGARPAGFVQKPFNLDQLANAVHAALHSGEKPVPAA